jgi:hypothetical protein
MIVKQQRTVDEWLLRAARVEAAREGRRVYEVIEDALRARYDLRAARDRARRAGAPELDEDEDEAMALAVEAVREVRSAGSRPRAA